MSNKPDYSELSQTRKMLEAMLTSERHIWWVGGYVHGRTSQGDPFILLYPGSDKLNNKICRVYEHQFNRLPAYVNTDVPATAQDGNPTRETAQRQGIYVPCPGFKIVTTNGKETQMGPERRFFDTLWAPAAPTAAPAGNGAKTAPAGSDIFSYRYGDGSEALSQAERAAFNRYRRANSERVPTNLTALRQWYAQQPRA